LISKDEWNQLSIDELSEEQLVEKKHQEWLKKIDFKAPSMMTKKAKKKKKKRKTKKKGESHVDDDDEEEDDESDGKNKELKNKVS
jgi:hypothetical protein